MPGRRRRTSTTSRTTTSRSTTTSKRATRATPNRAKKPVPDLPTAGPGERVWVLAVPFRAPAPGAVWRPDLQAHVWVGSELPPELTPYDPPPYTFEWFLEENGRLSKDRSWLNDPNATIEKIDQGAYTDLRPVALLDKTPDPKQAYARFEPSRRGRPSYWDHLPWA